MKIACLQFAPSVGTIEENTAKANTIIQQSNLENENIDYLVLPELALTGYNFPSFTAIRPYLEPTGEGISTKWAISIAKQLNCIVTIGYPELPSATDVEPSSTSPPPFVLTANPKFKPVVPQPPERAYNSTVTVSSKGYIIAHYRKSFLYYTDTTWATPGPSFYSGILPFRCDMVTAAESKELRGMKVAMGICMDINPHNFTAPWDDFEFANHVLSSDSRLAILSMAWSSHSLTPTDVQGTAASLPDEDTLKYWINRFAPLLERVGSEEVVLIMANRCGVEGSVVYVGSSTVMKIGMGRAEVWDVLGKGEEMCLIVDTDENPKFAFAMKTP